MIRGDTLADMEEAGDRLARARQAAGYATATEAATAMGTSIPGYIHHENGTRGFSRVAERYARFFRVNLEWLLTGRGEMKGRPAPLRIDLPLLGKVGAGAKVYMPEAAALPEGEAAGLIDEVEIALDGDFALEVEGDSQYPRYLPGERLLVSGQPVEAGRLIDQFAVVQLENDGMRLLKRIRRGSRIGLYDLESHNADTLRNQVILSAWRVKGVWYG